jgi:formylglycine-generating enzyme required for sulfatase activity
MPDYVFISYARDDNDFVLKLTSDLAQRGVSVWLDTGSIRAGEAWRGSIVEAIENCTAFLIVLSPKSVASSNVVKELAIAGSSAKPIIPLVHRDHELKPEMKYTLAGLQRLDFARGRYEDNLAYLVEVLPGETEQPEEDSGSISKHITSKSLPDLLQITTPIQMELIRVPAGEFLMGSDPAKDQYAQEKEQPQHPLRVAEFYIGKYLVTNVQYLGFVNAKGLEVPENWEYGNIPKGKEIHPVVHVTWYDALAFCEWLSSETSHKFNLPSEVEWEYAARGGPLSKGYLYSGSDDPHEVAWFKENSGGDTHPVGKKQSNEMGVYDMSGNVWEWTRSLWGKFLKSPDFNYPYDSRDGREDLHASRNTRRVLRGGAFIGSPRVVRCAGRFRSLPDLWNLNVGFRVVVFPPGSDL